MDLLPEYEILKIVFIYRLQILLSLVLVVFAAFLNRALFFKSWVSLNFRNIMFEMIENLRSGLIIQFDT